MSLQEKYDLLNTTDGNVDFDGKVYYTLLDDIEEARKQSNALTEVMLCVTILYTFCELGNHEGGFESDGSQCPRHATGSKTVCSGVGGGEGDPSDSDYQNGSNNKSDHHNTGGGQSSNDTGNNDNDAEITEMVTVINTITPLEQATNEFFDDLTDEQKDCLARSKGFKDEITVFFENSQRIRPFGYDGPVIDSNITDFANAAIDAHCAGGDVDFDDKIINNLTNPCAKNIFIELENGLYKDHPIKPEVQILEDDITTLNFSETILKLFHDSRNTELTIQNGDVNIANANTVRANITISDAYLASATQLSITRTMIHESVHAYLNAYFYGYPDFQNKSIRDKLHEFAKDKGFTSINTFHHEFMGQYVDAIGYSLYEWDKQYGTGGNLGWDYYRGMSFGGLFQVDPSGKIVAETDAFKSLIPNPVDRQNIANILVNEQKNNSDAKGTICD